MAREPDDRLATSLDRLARERPLVYRLRLALLLVLGYGYFVLFAALIACALGVVVYFIYERGLRAAVPTVITSFILLVWSLRIALGRIRDPHVGVALRRSDAPELWKTIDSIRTRMRAPRIHRVSITNEINAAVARIPRLLPYPRVTQHLRIGLPLLWTLRKDLFDALLAHEIGHVSRAHGRFGNVVYESRAMWLGILAVVENTDHWTAFLQRRFIRWYAPFFATYSMALARAQEYEADSAAARAAGGAHLAATLLRIGIMNSVIDAEYWARIEKSVLTRADPPETAISGMRTILQKALSEQECEVLLARILCAHTGEWDTHPSLGDRLESFGIAGTAKDLPGSVRSLAMEAAGREAAASSLLGVAEPDVATELDAEYAMATRDAWTQRHREMRSLAARLEVLEKKAAILPLGPGEKLDRIAWTAELEGAAAALPLAHGFAADPVNASNAEARFVLGRLLLATDDGAGLEHLDAAIRLDANLIVPASEMAFAFLNAAGRTVEAETYHRNTMGSTKDGRNAAASRSRTGGYVAHGLSSTAVTGMNAAFGRQGGVRRAFLVRTATGFRRSGVVLNEQQLLLAIEPRRGQDSAAIIDALITEMDALESLVIVVLEGRFRRWLSAIRDTPDALLFDERAQAP